MIRQDSTRYNILIYIYILSSLGDHWENFTVQFLSIHPSSHTFIQCIYVQLFSLWDEATLRVQYLAQGHLCMWNGDRPADLHFRGRPLYPWATASQYLKDRKTPLSGNVKNWVLSIWTQQLLFSVEWKVKKHFQCSLNMWDRRRLYTQYALTSSEYCNCFLHLLCKIPWCSFWCLFI